MHELLYNVLSLILLLAFGALVWFRRRLRMAQILLVLSSFGLLFWFSAGFDWRVFDERPYATPPPDQCWNLAETTDLLDNQAARQTWTFRGREVNRHKAPDGLRIVALGTSSTFGSGLLASEPPYPAVLEQRLREATGRRIEVINAGFTGYHSFQLMILLTQVLVELSPDLVLFYYGRNEGSGNEVKRYYEQAARIKERAACRTPACLRWAIGHGVAHPVWLRLGAALEKMGLYRRLRNDIMRHLHRHPRGIEPDDGRPELQPHSEEILQRMTVAAAEHGFTLVLIPELQRDGSPANPGYRELMQRAADNHRVFFLEFTPPFAPPADCFLDDIHPTAAGHRQLGTLLAAKLLEQTWMP